MQASAASPLSQSRAATHALQNGHAAKTEEVPSFAQLIDSAAPQDPSQDTPDIKTVAQGDAPTPKIDAPTPKIEDGKMPAAPAMPAQAAPQNKPQDNKPVRIADAAIVPETVASEAAEDRPSTPTAEIPAVDVEPAQVLSMPQPAPQVSVLAALQNETVPAPDAREIPDVATPAPDATLDAAPDSGDTQAATPLPQTAPVIAQAPEAAAPLPGGPDAAAPAAVPDHPAPAAASTSAPVTDATPVIAETQQTAAPLSPVADAVPAAPIETKAAEVARPETKIAAPKAEAPGAVLAANDNGTSLAAQPEGASVEAAQPDMAQFDAPLDAPEAPQPQATPATVTAEPVAKPMAPNTNMAVHAPAQPQMAAANTNAAAAPQTAQHVEVSASPKPDVTALAVEISARSQSGAKQFDIRLDPPELGRVEVRLSIDATGKASAHLSADQPQTLELLQKDSSVLTRALRDAGLEMAQDSLNFSLRQQAQGQQGGAQRGQARGTRQHLTATQSIQPTAASASYRANGGVDIRV